MALDTAAPADRFPLDVQRTRIDGETRTDLHIRDGENPWAQTACRILAKGRAAPRLHAAFSIDAIDVALPEDIPVQEALNAAMEAALAQEFPRRAPALAAALREAWQRTVDRLEARWAVTTAQKPNLDDLCMTEYDAAATLYLASGTTAFGTDDRFGVERRVGRVDYKKWRLRGDKPVRIIRKRLDPIVNLTAHQKLDILNGQKGREYVRARAAFEAKRIGVLPHVEVMPMTGHEGIAIVSPRSISHNVEFLLPEKASAKLYIHVNGDRRSFDLTRKLRHNRCDSILKYENGTLKIARAYDNGDRFKSPALLDEALRRSLALFLAWDETLPDWIWQDAAAPFDPAHPVLKGIAVPPRHQPFIGALLAAPYDRAHKRATRYAAKLAKEERQAKSVALLPDLIADGAMFGTVGKGLYNDTKLMIVKAQDAPKDRRRLWPVCNAGMTDRPLTLANIARLDMLDDPDALRLVHDGLLEGKARDLVEAVFRLSFALEPKARNPFLEEQTNVMLLDDLPTGLTLRVTVNAGSRDCSMIALSVADLDPDEGMRLWPIMTGAGITAMRTFGERSFHLRPANIEWEISLPDDHRATIAAGIDRLRETERLTPEDAATFHTALADEWTALKKEYP